MENAQAYTSGFRENVYIRFMKDRILHRQGLISLSPLIVFLVSYLVLSILAQDFYSVPIIVAFLISCICALLLMRNIRMRERMTIFSKGAGRPDTMLMIWIFILAGGFAATAKSIGAIEATVNLSLFLLPSQFLLCGLFLATCFISFCIGTSVGTIAALIPIASGIADKTGQSLPLIAAIVVGGAFFGDNLSLISDTTIVSTKSQGCEMRDKFKTNFWIVLPAAILTMLLYYFLGGTQGYSVSLSESSILLILPYLYILVTALWALDVITVLVTSTILNGILGLILGKFTYIGWLNDFNSGVLGMSELIIVTLLASGMAETIRYMHGIEYLMQSLSSKIKSRRGAEFSIASLVFFTNLCTANNTIAILTVGPLTKEISTQFHVNSKRAASLLDTFSCFAQGIIPYGAQLLIASNMAKISPSEIIPYLFYPFLLCIVSILNIIFYEKNQHYRTGHTDPFVRCL